LYKHLRYPFGGAQQHHHVGDADHRQRVGHVAEEPGIVGEAGRAQRLLERLRQGAFTGHDEIRAGERRRGDETAKHVG
jgi:hypothetical protein